MFKLIVLTALYYAVSGDNPNILRVTRIDCDFKKELVTNFSCSVVNITKIRTAINANFYLARTFDEIVINMQTFKKVSGQYLPFIINITGSICDVMDGKLNIFYVTYMTEWVSKYSNVVHKCPYSGELYLKQLEPHGEKLPVFVPPGDYRLDLNFYSSNSESKNKIGTIKGYGTLEKKQDLL